MMRQESRNRIGIPIAVELDRAAMPLHARLFPVSARRLLSDFQISLQLGGPGLFTHRSIEFCRSPSLSGKVNPADAINRLMT